MYLDEIIAFKKTDLEQRQREMPASQLEAMACRQESPRDFTGALKSDGLVLIAEIKKASPSKGVLCQDFDPVRLARTYAASGAQAISVLTEERFFQGSLYHLAAVKKAVDLPVLRKDFIFTHYQVLEARAYGADAILLIAAILSEQDLARLSMQAASLGIACLVEVHDSEDLNRALAAGAEIIGINNRDLRTFAVDLETTRRLCELVPPIKSGVPRGKTIVSESGIVSRADVEKVERWGAKAILVGESLLTAPDIGQKIRELMGR